MEFIGFPSISRLSREIVITEKIDGTNASVTITEDGQFLTGSRTRWITPQDDNYGFSGWAHENKEELLKLGVGSHFGEWWGRGIQRNYSLTTRKFSLFNVSRWEDIAIRPACCDIVPILFRGEFEEYGVMKGVKAALSQLKDGGSVASPGFMRPEGIVLYHRHSNQLFKKTFEHDDKGKSYAA